MHFIHEEHVAGLEAQEHVRNASGAIEGLPHLQTNWLADLASDDLRQHCLSCAAGPGKDQMRE